MHIRLTKHLSSSPSTWGPHVYAHNWARELNVHVGVRPHTSLAFLREKADKAAEDRWTTKFHSTTYQGSDFFWTGSPDGGHNHPSAFRGGPWLQSVKWVKPQKRKKGKPRPAKKPDTLNLFTRMCRCITGHAPIGSYYFRFNIPASTMCKDCGALMSTRFHIFNDCQGMELNGQPSSLDELVKFLRLNPSAFAFNTPPEGVG